MIPDASTIPKAVLEVIGALQGAGHVAYLVGGCVRDMFRGQSPEDFDVATGATPPQVQALFKRVIPTGIEHGTVTVVTHGMHVEVTTFRSEADYVDGRRPSKVEFHTDLEVDLSRRDFTINAMAFDPVAGRLEDPFGGRADLAAHVVRCVRDAHQRFSEDGLRALRAVRFATVLDFTLDPATEAAIAPTMPVFRKVAGERVNQELTRLLLAPHVAAGLALLERTTLLFEIAPEARGADFAAVGRAQPDLALRLAVLLAGSKSEPDNLVRDVVLRLRFPNKLADEAAHLVRHRALPADDVPDSKLRRWLATVDPTRALAVIELNRALGADVATLELRVRQTLERKPPLTVRELALDGRGIMAALDVGPSAIVGQAARHLLDLVIDDPTLNTLAALSRALEAWAERRR